MTQEQWAETAGLHLHGLTKLKHGDRKLAWEIILALPLALGVSYEAFNQSAVSRSELRRSKPKPAAKRLRGRPKKGN